MMMTKTFVEWVRALDAYRRVDWLLVAICAVLLLTTADDFAGYCKVIKEGANHTPYCLEALLYRYQTLLGAGVAVFAALLAARKVNHQIIVAQRSLNVMKRDMLFRERTTRHDEANNAKDAADALNNFASELTDLSPMVTRAASRNPAVDHHTINNLRERAEKTLRKAVQHSSDQARNTHMLILCDFAINEAKRLLAYINDTSVVGGVRQPVAIDTVELDRRIKLALRDVHSVRAELWSMHHDLLHHMDSVVEELGLRSK